MPCVRMAFVAGGYPEILLSTIKVELMEIQIVWRLNASHYRIKKKTVNG